MICPRCKKELPDGSNFCLSCGKKLVREQHKRARGNGQGSVYKRGRSYTACVVVGHKVEDNKKLPVRRYKGGFKTKAEALEYLPTLRGDRPKAPVTLSDLYQGWSTSAMLKLSDSKQTAFKIAYNRIKDIAYTDIKHLDISALQNCVDKHTTSFYTARDVKALLSHLYTRAMAQQDVTQNLSRFIELPDLEEKEQMPFNEAEIKNLWTDYGKGNTFTGYILLMIYSGMMPGELLKAKKSMIDWDTQQINGCGLKTKKRKETPLVVADFVVPVLADLCEHSTGQKLVTMNKDNFYKIYYETIERCGCRKLPPYSCRHTTATALALGNVAPTVIQEIMRHTKFQTTQRYIHVDTTPMLEALNMLKSKKEKEACQQQRQQ